jgi:hypothetical protein
VRITIDGNTFSDAEVIKLADRGQDNLF